VHWQVTRIIAIMTVPNKSAFPVDNNCVNSWLLARPLCQARARQNCKKKGAVVRDAAKDASVAFGGPILIQCRPVPIQVSEAGRNASGGTTLFGGPAYFIGHFGNSVNDPPRTDWKRNFPVRLRGVPGESLQRTGLSGRRIYFRGCDGA